MRKFFLLLLIAVFFSFTGTSLKKRISDALYRYEFYTTDQTVTALPDREYFWFKGGEIHNSEYGVGGELLQDEYLKFYHNNQLAEAGKYDKGLKKGYWKSWYKSGILQSKVYWDEGQMDGSYFTYNHTGDLVEDGKFKNNRKHGRWINHITKDTLKYRNGKLVIKKVKDTAGSKPGILKRIFTKKRKDSVLLLAQQPVEADKGANNLKKKSFLKKVFSKKEKQEQNQVRQNQQRPGQNEKKPGFIKRVFTKKKSAENGKGS